MRHGSFRNLVHVLEHQASHHFDGTAYVYLANGRAATDEVTFAELRRRVVGLAAKLREELPAGGPVVLACDSTLEFFIGFLALIYAGAVPVPIPMPRKNQRLDRLRSVLRSSGARAALVGAGARQTLLDLLAPSDDHPGLRVLEVVVPEGCAEFSVPDVGSDDLALLQYTSGSTGAPSGVMVSHRNLLCNSEIIARSFDHSSSTVYAGWLPPFHDMGLIGVLVQSLYLGCPCVLMPPLAFLQSPIRWLDVVSRYHVTTTGGPNFGYDLCARKATDEDVARLDLSSWRVAFNGAEPVRAETMKRFRGRFAPSRFRPQTLFPCYGLAEGTLMLAGGQPHTLERTHLISKAGLRANRIEAPLPSAAGSVSDDAFPLVSCGFPRLDTRIAVVDPESRLERLDLEIGEIWVRGMTVAQGYWQKKEKTEERFGAYLKTGEGPFMRTGDLAYIWDGQLYITGRLKDLIIVRGENFYPQDLEACAAQHPALAGVAGAAFAVHEAQEDRVVLLHEVNFEHRKQLQVSAVERSVKEAVLREYGVALSECILVERRSLPQTSSGKIMRAECRERYHSGLLRRVSNVETRESSDVAERAG